MKAEDVINELSKMGQEQTKKTLIKHGAVEPLFGVKVGDLKKIQKKVKTNHPLALELYATGISDAMYLAGLIADEKTITKQELNAWVMEASCDQISEYTVPWIAAESPYGWECGMEWIDSEIPRVAASGWNTLSNWVALKEDGELNISVLRKLLHRIVATIKFSPNRVRYCMNTFVISLGGYVQELTEECKTVATKIGKVEVSMGETACKVPDALSYIEKIESMGRIGNKKKKARC